MYHKFHLNNGAVAFALNFKSALLRTPHTFSYYGFDALRNLLTLNEFLNFRNRGQKEPMEDGKAFLLDEPNIFLGFHNNIKFKDFKHQIKMCSHEG